jgi:(4S)-4-hydroxy-5-phosphonooxypentane-2,3-dione isomerase
VSNFALIVTMKIKPGCMEDFKKLILENAEAARRDEPGNHGFKVVASHEDENTLYFYEEYTDEEAFKAHQNAPHFKKYFEAAKDMMAERIWFKGTVIG